MNTRLLKIGGLALLALVLVGAAAGLWFWNQMQQPLYTPGMVRLEQNLRAPLDPPAQPARANTWQVESDIALHYIAQGTGTPLLVVHGGPGMPFSRVPSGFQPLAGSYRVYLYDQRGCGQSSRPLDRFSSSNYYEDMQTLDRTLGLGAQIADVERIRRLLGQDRLILVGHSFGGFIASLYAAEFPEHVRALVLVAPADVLVMPPPDGGLYEQLKGELPPELQVDYQAFLTRYLDYGSLFSKSESDLAALNGEFARYYTAAAARRGMNVPTDTPADAIGGWMGQAMYLSMGLKHDYRPALHAVTAPVLVLHGDKDLQPVAASQAYADAFPNAELRVIPDAGHFVFDDQPAAFASAVADFLSRSNH